MSDSENSAGDKSATDTAQSTADETTDTAGSQDIAATGPATPTVAELLAQVSPSPQKSESPVREEAGIDSTPSHSNGTHQSNVPGAEIQQPDSTTEPGTRALANGESTPTTADQHEPTETPADLSPSETECLAVVEGPTKKAKGLGPRWSYILIRGTIVAAIWAFFAYAFDPLMKMGVVSSSESMVGAKVDIEGFSTTLFPPAINFENVQVANADQPERNLVEFAEMRGKISGIGLLKGSYVVDEATITGLRWDTTRATSGKLEESPTAPEDDDAEGLFDKAGDLGKKWADGLLKRVKLDYDPKNYESVRLATRFEDEWKTDFDDLETRIKSIDDKFKELRDLVKNAKGNPLERIQAYDKARVEGTKLLRNLQRVKVDLARLPTKAKQDLQQLNTARQRDTAEIKSKVNDLFDGNGDDLSEFLLGPELHHKVERGLSWFQWADDRVEEFQERPKPKRFRGEDVHFETLERLPEYLVRLININGAGVIGGDQLAIEGTIRDVTSDPVLHGKPIVLRLEGKGEGLLQIKSTFDRTKVDAPRNVIDFEYELPRVIEQDLGDRDSLLVNVSANNTRWHGVIRTDGDLLSGTVSMVQTPVKLTASLSSKVDARIQQIVEASVRNVRRIDALVRISGTVKKPKLKLETNLGKVISKGVQEGLQDQITAEKDALIAKLNSSFSEKQNRLVALFNSRHGRVDTALKTEEVGIQSLIPRIGANKGFNPTKLFR